MRRSPGTVSLMRSSPPVTPASAMKLPISMWSGATSCSQPRSFSAPLTVIRLEPMPWMSAPIFTSMRARSCTCGSEAALPITVVPGVSAAASSTFSVAITDGSSMNTSVERRPCGASSTMPPLQSTLAPIARKASRCGSRRRRPITSPPGGAMAAWPKRASSGPASRNEARISSASSCSTSISRAAAAHSATSLAPRQLTATPSARRMSSIASTSRMRGTLRTTTSSSVRRDDARIGSAPFLLPAGTIVPESGTPPSMTNFSMSCGARRRRPHGGAFASRLASVTAICTVKFAPRAHYPARAAQALTGVARATRFHRSRTRLPASAFCNSACSPIATYSALACGFARSRPRVHTFASAPSERPPTFYEQMFASAKTSKLAQRTLGALRLTRSFLMLEDDYDVDWEVDRDEQQTQTHPHRAPLRGPGRRSRRASRAPQRQAGRARPRLPVAGRRRRRRARRASRAPSLRARQRGLPCATDARSATAHIAPILEVHMQQRVSVITLGRGT